MVAAEVYTPDTHEVHAVDVLAAAAVVYVPAAQAGQAAAGSCRQQKLVAAHPSKTYAVARAP